MYAIGWLLGSLSPLEVLRGAVDMSLHWWHASPLLGAVKLLLVSFVIWGIIDIANAPGRGVIVSAGGLLALFALKGR